MSIDLFNLYFDQSDDDYWKKYVEDGKYRELCINWVNEYNIKEKKHTFIKIVIPDIYEVIKVGEDRYRLKLK